MAGPLEVPRVACRPSLDTGLEGGSYVHPRPGAPAAAGPLSEAQGTGQTLRGSMT